MNSPLKNNNEKIKRILIFSLTYEPFIGGAEIAVNEITERLPHYEFDMVTLRIDRKLPRFEKIGNVCVYRIGITRKKTSDLSFGGRFSSSFNKFLFPILAVWKAFFLHKRRRYDAIWSIMAAYAGFASLFFKLSHPGVPYILTLQEGDPIHHIQKKVRFVHPIWQYIFLKADIVQAISTYLASFAFDVGYKKNIEVIPNGVDFSLFNLNHPPHELEHLKNLLGKRTHLSGHAEGITPSLENDFLLVTVSRLVPKNGVEDIIRSLIYLPKFISLLIIGEGFLLKKLKSLVEELNLGERVRFEGFVSHEKLPPYLCVSDIFIRPSLSEGFGNSFIEAMAMRVPVIATPVGGIKDFVFDPYYNINKEPTGIFCGVNNPKSIAYCVRVLLSDKKLKDEIVKNAEKMVREKYDWNIIAKDMDEKVFKKVLK